MLEAVIDTDVLRIGYLSSHSSAKITTTPLMAVTLSWSGVFSKDCTVARGCKEISVQFVHRVANGCSRGSALDDLQNLDGSPKDDEDVTRAKLLANNH